MHMIILIERAHDLHITHLPGDMDRQQRGQRHGQALGQECPAGGTCPNLRRVLHSQNEANAMCAQLDRLRSFCDERHGPLEEELRAALTANGALEEELRAALAANAELRARTVLEKQNA